MTPTHDNRPIPVARTIGELSGLPVGTRIATNDNRILHMDKIFQGKHWMEKGTRDRFADPQVEWLPAYILPATVNHADDADN